LAARRQSNRSTRKTSDKIRRANSAERCGASRSEVLSICSSTSESARSLQPASSLRTLTMTLVLVTPDSSFRNADAMWLRLRDIPRVEQILKQNRTITDEEMREITTRQLRNVLESQGKASAWTRQKTYVGLPLLVTFGCAFFLPWVVLSQRCFFVGRRG
jgi:hypothetical protein